MNAYKLYVVSDLYIEPILNFSKLQELSYCKIQDQHDTLPHSHMPPDLLYYMLGSK